MKKIPYCDLKRIHEKLQNEMQETFQNVIKQGIFIQGEMCRLFEKEFATFCGVKYGIGVGNGLDALRMILLGYGIGMGDEVIIPANTFIATALAVSMVGAKPVFVDVDRQTYNIDMDKIQEKITHKTKAVIIVHLYGRAVNIDSIRIKLRDDIRIIEDAAQAHGARICGKMVGSLGDAAAFSFYPGKNIGALGDGGMVTTNDITLAKKITMLRNYGSEEKYHHEYLGCNSRLDELQAAFLRIKLKHLSEWNRERIEIAEYYNENIRNVDVKLPMISERGSNVYHIYPVLVSDRERFIAYLENQGIITNIHYPIPIMDQKAYTDLGEISADYPITKEICEHEVSIPLFPGMEKDEVKKIVDCINSYY